VDVSGRKGTKPRSPGAGGSGGKISGGVRKGPGFEPVFLGLRKILEPYGRRMSVEADTGVKYCLNAPGAAPNGKPLFFGAVIAGKAYVSYHLMPLYLNTGIMKTIPPELRKRMQGKTCFNFTRVDERMFRELAAVTAECVRYVKSDAFLAVMAKRGKTK
jgi:hypothetical protein